MRRDFNLSEMTDGKRYTSNDLARLGCGNCAGCSACCKERGSVIPLDPYDMYMLCKETGKNFDILLDEKKIRLCPVDGVILPCLNVQGEEEACAFLDVNGRCTVHQGRPSICRLFPLARIYEADTFSYVLQVNECEKSDGSKIKISKWLGIPNLKQYEKWVIVYHGLLKQVEEIMGESTPEMKQKINLGFLTLFFRTPYRTEEDFYPQFVERKQEMI